jgi:hypothetical protein
MDIILTKQVTISNERGKKEVKEDLFPSNVVKVKKIMLTSVFDVLAL